MIVPTPAPAQFRAELRTAIAHEKSALSFFKKAMASDPQIRGSSHSLGVLSATFGSEITAQKPHRNTSSILTLLGSNTATLRGDQYIRAREMRPLVGESVAYLARERQALRDRLHAYEEQHTRSLRQVTAAQERLENVRRTLFIDTLLGQDPSMADPFLNQDPCTLFTWLKDALEAGRLSVPTAADLSSAMREADRDGTCEHTYTLQV